MPPREDKVYAKCFRGKKEGYFLYSPVLLPNMKPGTLGYFDQNGDWQRLIDITDKAEVTKKYTFVEDIKVEELPTETWLLTRSEGVQKHGAKVAGNAP